MTHSLIIEVDHFHFLDIINLSPRIQISANHAKDSKGEAPSKGWEREKSVHYFKIS